MLVFCARKQLFARSLSVSKLSRLFQYRPLEPFLQHFQSPFFPKSHNQPHCIQERRIEFQPTKPQLNFVSVSFLEVEAMWQKARMHPCNHVVTSVFKARFSPCLRVLVKRWKKWTWTPGGAFWIFPFDNVARNGMFGVFWTWSVFGGWIWAFEKWVRWVPNWREMHSAHFPGEIVEVNKHI